MNESTLQKNQTAKPVPPVARISAPHGYRFDGDTVHLQARLTVLDHAAHQRSWALQLWACPQAPTSASDLAGHLVAEVALPPMSEAADEIEHIEGSTIARPPAGNGRHVMALVLASGQPGRFDEVHDLAVYAAQEQFTQPRMRGAVAYRIEGNRVHVTVEHIENPRESANRSGTLAVELWALAAPYSGGSFQGAPVAGVVIGSLAGQSESTITSFDLPFSLPPSGTWHLVLMLREWTAAGYVTRDFTNFAAPVTYGAQTAAKAPEAKAVTQPKVAPVVPAEQPAVVKTAPTLQVVARPNVTASVNRSVSINTAAEHELAAVQGISQTLARAIVKKRPFASLDDLRRVRGVTVKVLASIRSRLKV